MEDLQERCFENQAVDTTEGNPAEANRFAKCLQVLLDRVLARGFQPLKHANDYTLYTGMGGVAYMLAHLYERFSALCTITSNWQGSPLSSQQTLLDNLNSALHKALEEERKDPDDVVTFVLGAPGLYCVAAATSNCLMDSKQRDFYVSAVLEYENLALSSKVKPNEILYGRAGYLFALMYLTVKLGSSLEESFLSRLFSSMDHVYDALIKEGRAGSTKKSPLMYEWHHKQYLGAAHGLAGILFLLLHFPNKLKDASIVNDIKGSIEYLLSLEQKNGNWPSSPDDKYFDKVHWCHGAPAMVFLFSKAYEIFQDSRYLAAAERASDLIWKYGLLKKGLGICHGVAGNGYTFLSLYRTTRNTKYLQRARHFASFCCSVVEQDDSLLKRPDNPYSLFEGLDTIVPELALFPAFELRRSLTL